MKRKFLTVLAVLSAMLCCTLFQACSEYNCSGDWNDMEHFGRKEPTCTQSGWDYYDYCPICGKYWASPHKKGKETTPERQKFPRWGIITKMVNACAKVAAKSTPLCCPIR